jgi:hypothetical protein
LNGSERINDMEKNLDITVFESRPCLKKMEMSSEN